MIASTYFEADLMQDELSGQWGIEPRMFAPEYDAGYTVSEYFRGLETADGFLLVPASADIYRTLHQLDALYEALADEFSGEGFRAVTEAIAGDMVFERDR